MPKGFCANTSSAFLTKLPRVEEVPTNTWCIKLTLFGASAVVHFPCADSVLCTGAEAEGDCFTW